MDEFHEGFYKGFYKSSESSENPLPIIKMAPSAIDPPALPKRVEKTYPPAKIFNVKENKFEKPITPQADGREKALAQPDGSAAIVIDNGKPGFIL